MGTAADWTPLLMYGYRNVGGSTNQRTSSAAGATHIATAAAAAAAIAELYNNSLSVCQWSSPVTPALARRLRQCVAQKIRCKMAGMSSRACCYFCCRCRPQKL